MLRGSYDKVQSKHQESFPNDIFNFLSFPRKIFSLWHFKFFVFFKENLFIMTFWIFCPFFPRKILSLWHFEFFTLQSLRCNIFNSLYFQRKFSCCYVLNSMYLEVIKFSLGYTMIRFRFPFAITPFFAIIIAHVSNLFWASSFRKLRSRILKTAENPENALRIFLKIKTFF